MNKIYRYHLLVLLLVCGSMARGQGIYPFSGTDSSKNLSFSFYSPLIYGNPATYNNNTVHTVSNGPVQHLTDTSTLYSSSAATLDIDSLGDQTIFYNNPREFYITSAALSAAGKSIVGRNWFVDTSVLKGRYPLGTALFNRYNLFRYTTNSDTLDFYLRFQLVSNKGDTVTSKPVHFKIVPAMPYEISTFGVGGTHNMPDPSDPEYIVRTKVSYPNKRGGGLFNKQLGIDPITYSYSGVTVILDSSNSDMAGLTYNFTKQGCFNVDTLNIYAETVVVRDPMWFPNTIINIYAKELKFVDQNGKFAYLMTTPLGRSTAWSSIPPTGSMTGGLDGGAINLHVLSVTADPGKRLITTGGDGDSVSNTVADYKNYFGLPGNGGNVTSTVDVSSLVLSDGGYSGGKEFSPSVTYRGSEGEFILNADSIATWLHPNFFKVLVNYYRDGFYNGLTTPITKNLKWYSDIFDKYNLDSSINKVGADNLQELKHSVDEVRKTFYNIANNLDYFGNPSGWVPMLSFEVAQSVYSSEVKHAINILFLEDLVNTTNTSLINRKNALSNLQNEAQALAKSNLDTYNNIATVIIPGEKQQMADNKAKISSITAQLQALNDELNAKAKETYDNRHNPWEEALGGVATVCSMIPLPVTQGISVGLNVASQAIGGDFATSFKNGQGIAKQVVDFAKPLVSVVSGQFTSMSNNLTSSFGQISSSISQFSSAVNGGDLSAIGSAGKKIASQCSNIYTSNKSIIDSLSNEANAAVDLYNNITKVNEGELGSIRGELVAKEPRVAQFQEEIQKIQQDQQQLAQAIQQSTNEMLEAQNSVFSNLSAVSKFNSAAYDANAAINHFLTVYAHDLSRKSVERMRKYHYYMAKAYEYRTLKPYNGNLNMASIVKQIDKMITDSSRTQLSQLTKANYDAIQGVYDEEVRSIVDETYTYYQSNRPSQTLPATYRLSADEIASLNAGKTVKLNLIETGTFRKGEEDIRIESLRVLPPVFEPFDKSKLGSTANVDFTFNYPNFSRIKKNGIIYSFNNYNLKTQYPIYWTTRKDFIDGSIADSKTPTSVTSLLSSLFLDVKHDSKDNSSLFSSPAAWADISLKMDPHNPDFSDYLPKLDSLIVQIVYNYLPKPSNIVSVQLNASNKWFAPTFDIDAKDNNGNKSGYGDVHRSYNVATSNFVKATAPTTYGKYTFDKWTDQGGGNITYGSDIKKVVGVPNAISFNLSTDRYFKASYKYQGPIMSLPDTVFLGNNLTYSLNIANTGVTPLYWQVDTSNTARWIKYNGKLYGLNDTTIKLSFVPLGTCSINRIGKMDITSTETEALHHYIVFVQGPRNAVLDTTTKVAPVTPTVTIAGNDTIKNAGAFSASIKNGGVLPIYQWVKNSTLVGTSSSNYNASGLNIGDTIRCLLFSSLGCVTDYPAVSNSIVIQANLPVTFSRFTGFYSSGYSNLNWVTETEINTSSFVIERSKDAINFTVVGNVPAKNNRSGGIYSFNDKLVDNGTYYYRLKVVDKDGKVKYSSIVVIKMKGGLYFSAYPNPVNSKFTLQIQNEKPEEAMVQVINILGKVVYQKQVQLALGMNTLDLDLTNLASGSYTLLLKGESIKRETFIKQ